MTATDVRPNSDAAATAAAVAAAIRTVDSNIATFGDRYPADTTDANRYPLRPPSAGQPEGANVGWTTSFWPGMLWLAHDLTGDERHLRAALSHVDSFAARMTHGIDLDTHDLGFLYTLACVTPARRTGDPQARDAALAAADHLMTRVLEPAGIIQAWGDLNDPRQRGRTIIDSLMNTPLLFWASQSTGDDRYAAAARRHTAQLRQHILRPDGTTFHTFYWDPASGAPLRGETEQGHSDHSCWARGQAWGIYGFSLNHRHIGDPALLAAARTCADRFLAHLPDDHVAYWDLEFGDGSGQERDSSAAAIAVCGLIELADGLTDDTASADRYRKAAAEILRSLIGHYSTGGHPASNALILHGVYDKPKSVGVDEGTLWGDYFYLEALTRATIPGWTSPW
ncbi:glycoside hydrolase family 88 protein [Micromonospora sp. NBC_00362]|uniref:glycoside hydrolase family 88 protein n=1 Tax=unclassified Micromonospora TaxID=2617518 RepID=UPI002254DE0C|nr:glycoside hydrolase family 88 protein [Micromonospora sp. NBC_00362]MCX5115620.1 glycoside hydrolase family 88 protein [Micromonospora sp. NBC_00362]WTI06053.1 glycoside hydrolase family 88 protein [Micromonospora sp. NBC_00821]